MWWCLRNGGIGFFFFLDISGPAFLLPVVLLCYPSSLPALWLHLSIFPFSSNEPELVCLWLRMAHLSVSKGIIIPLGSSAFCERWQVQGNFEIIYNDGSCSEKSIIIIRSCPEEQLIRQRSAVTEKTHIFTDNACNLTTTLGKKRK